MEIGDLIRQERERLGWSQVELSRRAGVSQSLITLMEQNKRGTRVDTLVKVTDVLGISPDVVFEYIRGSSKKGSSSAPIDVLEQVRVLMQRVEQLERERQNLDSRESDSSVSRRGTLPRVGVLQLA